MFRTADGIEEAKSVREPTGVTKYKRGQHPNSRKNLLAPWKPGQPGNPTGKQRTDIAGIIARAILEENQEEVYKALGQALLKGNAYVFKELAERAYGKIKEHATVEHTGADGAPLAITIKLVKADGKS